MKKLSLVSTVTVAGLMTLPAPAADLFDNGAPDGINGYSNGTEGIFGLRRTLLDDFTVPAGQVFEINDFHWRSIWGSGLTGLGTTAELQFRADDSGTPGGILTTANVNSYSEVGTGNVYFSRDEVSQWITFDEITLGPGTYWFEMTVVGPENNFWLTTGSGVGNCWVNYEDFNGLEPGFNQFGVDSDLNFILTGAPTPGALALLGLAGLAKRRRRNE